MSDRPRVLLCDDEPHIVRALKIIMRDAGFDAVTAESAAQARQVAALQPLDAAILDLLLPDGDGIGVCLSFRAWSSMPIIILSAIGDEQRKIQALEAGADDYITKPFSPPELIARLRSALRRAQPQTGEPVIRVEDLEIDLAGRRVICAGEDVHLTPIEFELLKMLVRNRGRLLTHGTLLREVWGPAYVKDVPTLRTSIARLRRKIEPDDAHRRRFIRTDQGVGYRFGA